MTNLSNCQWIDALLLVIMSLIALGAHSATVVADSVSQTDVETAKNLVRHGDTLIIPAGEATWTTSVTFTQYCTIRGAGTNSGATLTKITRTTAGDMFNLAPIAPGLTWIDQIMFSGGSYSTSLDIKAIHSTKTNTHTRISRCLFEFGKRMIHMDQMTWGVVDHCGFINVQIAFATEAGMSGSESVKGDNEWASANRWGTTNILTIEDCWALRDGNVMEPDPNSFYYGQGAACYIVRHNLHVATNLSNCQWIDAHGWPNSDSWGRGSRNYEIYSNLFVNLGLTDFYRIGIFRGGTHLFYSNVITGPATAPDYHFRDEGILNSGMPSTQDHNTNTFFFSNTYNGAAFTPSVSSESAAYISEDVNYFLRAPQSGDALYPYTPLVYPHPLVTALDGGGGGAGTRSVASGRVNFSGRVKVTTQ